MRNKHARVYDSSYYFLLHIRPRQFDQQFKDLSHPSIKIERLFEWPLFPASFINRKKFQKMYYFFSKNPFTMTERELFAKEFCKSSFSFWRNAIFVDEKRFGQAKIWVCNIHAYLFFFFHVFFPLIFLKSRIRLPTQNTKKFD